MANGEAIDTLFRMAHSLKSMAASLGYEAIADLAHHMEDRMEGIRADGRVRGYEELTLLFRSLEMLEAMLSAVRNDQEPHASDEDLLRCLAEDPFRAGAAGDDVPDRVGGEPKKVPTQSLLLR
jgi:two-component system chemotaxis sensor kinase CheA